VELLERIAGDTLLDAIADGTFGIMKRPADRGKGLDGVAAHEPDYFNPVTEALEGTP
jgi:beta-lysine 5,6-aminomutase alpha subunit